MSICTGCLCAVGCECWREDPKYSAVSEERAPDPTEPSPLTEDSVRRIVREELAAATFTVNANTMTREQTQEAAQNALDALAAINGQRIRTRRHAA